MKIIGVVGAGTMGGGIAQVAAQAGYDVLLYDVFPAALERALGNLRGIFGRLVEKGKMAPADLEATLARIRTTTSLQDFAGADFVIEAAPEDLELKKRLFGELDQVCRPDVILATNTSSLSVTEVGALTRRQEHVVGLHFFNPVPLMALVEVIRGHRTAAAAAAVTAEVARRLGKTPVQARDTPGFIVNRVARPFYAEAFRLVSEGVAAVPQVDACLRGAGFRLGPFELMDLIGIDVNFAVTRSVYRQYMEETRFRPHPTQEKMVQAGLLGRKTGQGFYSYAPDAPAPAEVQKAAAAATNGPPAPGGRVVLVVARAAADAAPLLTAAAAAGLAADLLTLDRLPAGALELPGANLHAHVSPAAARAWLCVDLTHLPRAQKLLLVQALAGALPVDAPLVAAAAAAPVSELAAACPHPDWVVGLGGLPPYGGTVAELALPLQAAGWGSAALPPGGSPAAAAAGFFRLLGRDVQVLSDGPGLVAGRVLACLVNEAAHALMEGVASAADIDTAMKLGTNYPAGPLAWADTVGLDWVLDVLDHLHADHGDDRYRPAVLLRRLVMAGRTGRRAGVGFYRYE